jgi:hypothetical protein
MPKGKKNAKKQRKTLDRVSAKRSAKSRKPWQDESIISERDLRSQKRARGRPRKIPLNWVTGRAYNYRLQLQQGWTRLEAPLLSAQTVDDVTAAFENHFPSCARDFVPEQTADILALLRDPKFPKRTEAQIKFLADSLGGRPSLSLRTSRDICEKERARERRKSQHRILRNEFYIECTCGYKGPARDNACRKCGAQIPPSLYGLRSGSLS